MIEWAAMALWGGGRLLLVQQPEPRESAEPKKVVDKQEIDTAPSAYPMPAFSSDKNSGVTYGLLGALIFTDDTGRPDVLLTASLAYNTITKWNGEVDFHLFPSIASEFELDASVAEKVESEVKLYYRNMKLHDAYDLRVEAHELRSSTDRFFGRAENAPRSDESVLTSSAYFVNLAFGPKLNDELTLQGTFRWRHYRVGESLVENLPQMLVRFPNELGIEGGEVLSGGLLGTLDTRDYLTTPTRGTFAQISLQQAWYNAEGRSAPFFILGAQWTWLLPMDADKAVVTVVNAHAQAVSGRRIPFWELSSVGGVTTLRSYNDGRFTANDMIVFNVEERIRVYKAELFGISGDVQVAPFFDVGKVLDSLDDLVGSEAFRYFHYSYGIGFRGVVPPSFVGRLDIAFGPEGVAITIGLNYPF